jgi:RHS repeat-associated protein
MRLFRHLSKSLVLVFALSLTVSATRAQVQTGTPPFGSFGGGPDTINLAPLNTSIGIPVFHRAGRGRSFGYGLSYNSSIWFPASAKWQAATTWGFAQSDPMGYVTFTQRDTVCSANHAPLSLFSNWTYIDSSGTPHRFSFTTQSQSVSPCNATTKTGTSTDGSGYTMSATADQINYVTTPDGDIIHPTTVPGGGGSIQDRNGNQITGGAPGTYTDTLGTTALTVAGTAPNNTTFTFTPPAGGSAAYTMKYTSYTVQTAFGCSAIAEFPATSENLVSEIDLPDGSKYSFTYEPTPGVSGHVTGRLASVTFPTGGTITYAYTGGSNGIICTDGSASGLTRQTPDGTWTYARTQVSGNHWQTKITSPLGDDTVIDFQKDSAIPANSTNNFYETQRQTYQGSATSGTLLLTTNTCYNGNTSNCSTTSVSSPITQRTVTKQMGATGLICKWAYIYNSFGLLTEEDDFDWGSGAPGPLLRKTLTTYASLGNGIVDQVASTTIQDGAGNTVAQTTYTYDETTPTATSGTPEHVAITGSRGNATTIKKLVQGTGTFLTTIVSYFDTGNPQTVTDANGAQTTFNYSNATSTCGNTFSTSVSEPLSLSKSVTWNCTGAVATQLADENGQVATTAFTDPFFWRPASTTDQANATKNFFYPSSPSFNTLESKVLFNGGNSVVDMLTTLDSLGRPRVRQVRQGPSATNYDSTETDYDALGRANRGTLPYNGTAGQTNSSAPATTTTYDALGRPLLVTDGGGGTTSYSYTQNDVLVTIGPAPSGENTKRRQLEYDGLGRLTSVCEITSASGNGACGQTNAQTGYLTKYSYDTTIINSVLYLRTTITQNAQPGGTPQTRTYLHDLLGRLVSETNPESGTTTYTYDTDTTCGTSNGDRVKKTDAVGNVTCTAYDALHRPTAITYPSGSYASVTPAKHFVYDSATVNSVPMTNVKGRMAEAYTCTGACSSKITDEGFSYTVRGEPSDIYQSTPHSGGYYHVNALYWETGAPKQLGSLTGLPTITYTPDGEGRPNAVTASSGQNPVSGTVYKLYGTPPQLQVTLGSGDSDVFTLDPNTSRMNKYQFNVGSLTVTGTLSWNANGSLGSLSISDPFNSANTQNCSYTADDLARISKVDCGTAWGQTFAYDPFGNLQKTKISGSGGTSFAPMYQSSPSPTNRIALINGQAPTYDANGNSLNDTFRTFTWDAENRPVSIGTVNLTYDAIGRMVEQSVGSTNSEVVYSPLSAKLALMNGTTLTRAFVPLTGGATAVYNSSGLAYYRHADHLGSSRFASTPTQTLYSDTAYSPFGETYASSGAIDPSFTGQNQDTTSGLYDFLYREHDPYQSRWASPDPAGLAAANLADPQTFNRYAYVRNNPLALTDPLGLVPGCRETNLSGQCGPFNRNNDPGMCETGYGGGKAPCDFGQGGCTLDGTFSPCDWLKGLAEMGALEGVSNPLPNGPGGPLWLWLSGGSITTINHNDWGGMVDYSSETSYFNGEWVTLGQFIGMVKSYYAGLGTLSDDERLKIVARGVVRGAGGIGDWRFIVSFYVASFGSAAIDEVITDYAAGPVESRLFGRFAKEQGGGFPGFLNDPSYPIRLGFGWHAGEMLFRLTVDGLGHINFWSVPFP